MTNMIPTGSTVGTKHGPGVVQWGADCDVCGERKQMYSVLTEDGSTHTLWHTEVLSQDELLAEK